MSISKDIQIEKSSLNGKISLPGSKSHIQRILIAASMAHEPTLIKGVDYAEDIQAAQDIVKALGASVSESDSDIFLTPNFQMATPVLDCRESGFCARVFPSIASLTGKSFQLTGRGSLLERQIYADFLQLEQCGVNVEYEGNGIPAQFSRMLRGGDYTIYANRGSQLLSGLLFALPVCAKDSRIDIPELVSKAYIDLSIDVMYRFGVKVKNREYSQFIIPGGQTYESPGTIEAEADWSSAAVWIVAAALCGKVTLDNLNPYSRQADRCILQILSAAAVPYTFENGVLQVGAATPKAFDTDIRHCPDLFAAIVPLALAANGTSRIHGIDRLTNKESDRLQAILTEYHRMGAKTHTEGNVLVLESTPLEFAEVNAHNDHRMVMSLIVAGLANKGVKISGVEAIRKSYPGFFDDLKSIGGKIYA